MLFRYKMNMVLACVVNFSGFFIDIALYFNLNLFSFFQLNNILFLFHAYLAFVCKFFFYLPINWIANFYVFFIFFSYKPCYFAIFLCRRALIIINYHGSEIFWINNIWYVWKLSFIHSNIFLINTFHKFCIWATRQDNKIKIIT